MVVWTTMKTPCQFHHVSLSVVVNNRNQLLRVRCFLKFFGYCFPKYYWLYFRERNISQKNGSTRIIISFRSHIEHLFDILANPVFTTCNIIRLLFCSWRNRPQPINQITLSGKLSNLRETISKGTQYWTVCFNYNLSYKINSQFDQLDKRNNIVVAVCAYSVTLKFRSVFF